MKAETKARNRKVMADVGPGPVCAIEGSPLPPVKVTYHTSTEEWELIEAYCVTVDKIMFTIDAGFRFDLASIPRVAWLAIAPFELSLVAPLIHDFIYHYRGEIPSKNIEPDLKLSRASADMIFNSLMKLEGVWAWRRAIAYGAVRAFGGLYWST